jgi:hypothetical protein
LIELIAGCEKNLEQVEAGLALRVLREVIRVVGWVRPSWNEINDLIAE